MLIYKMRTNNIRFNGTLDAHFTAAVKTQGREATAVSGGSEVESARAVRVALLGGFPTPKGRAGPLHPTLHNRCAHRKNACLVHHSRKTAPLLTHLNVNLSPSTDSLQLLRADLELFPFSARGKRVC